MGTSVKFQYPWIWGFWLISKIDEGTSKADQKKKISKKPLAVTTKAPQKQPMQRTAKQTLPKASKPQPKQSAPIRKPVTQKPAIKSTYSTSRGRPSSAKSLMRPTSSRGSGKMYLDSALNLSKKNGTDSKAVSRKQGNVIVIWEGGRKSAWGGNFQPWSGGFAFFLVEFLFIFFWVPLYSYALFL